MKHFRTTAPSPEQRANDEGVQDYLEGASKNANQYTERGPLRRAWFKGWYDAEAECLDGEEETPEGTPSRADQSWTHA